jgi:hypothetical protein
MTVDQFQFIRVMFPAKEPAERLRFAGSGEEAGPRAEAESLL